MAEGCRACGVGLNIKEWKEEEKEEEECELFPSLQKENNDEEKVQEAFFLLRKCKQLKGKNNNEKD